MGRGSDTRIYAPRSESSTMYSSANEDETRYGPPSSYDKEKRMDEKKEKEESRKTKLKDIKHIKIKPSQGLLAGSQLETEPGLDDGNKRDDEREMGLQGGPAGSRGALLDLATGAKSGTGSSMGSIMASEPMDDAWSELLKEDKNVSPRNPGVRREQAFNLDLFENILEEDDLMHYDEMTDRQRAIIDTKMSLPVHLFSEGSEMGENLNRFLFSRSMHESIPDHHYENELEYLNHYKDAMENNDYNHAKTMEIMNNGYEEHPEHPHAIALSQMYPDFDKRQKLISDMYTPDDTWRSTIETGEPMDDAWSSLLKEEDGPHTFNINEVLNNPKESWYQSVMGTDTPLIDGLVNAGLMSAFGFEDHHHGDAESISGMHDDDLHPQGSLDMLMMHRNSLFVLDSIMRGKGHTVPQEFMDMHNNSDLTQALGDIPPHAHIAANLEGMYNNLNYLGQKIGPQMNEPDEDWQNKLASKPMDNAWSTLMKRETPSTMAARRRREKRQEFRPSTGQFKTPPGGMSGGAGATMRRFKGQMRGIKGSKKTGLMKPHLSVEMSHRGIATKQPMSKDPQKYGQYMGQSEARKRLGNVRTVFSPHARHSARSFSAGPTGAGRLSGLMPGQQGLMSRPSLRRMRAPRPPRMPRMRRPPMPMAPQMAPPMSSVPSMPAPSSSMMMSEDRTESDFLKSNRHAGRTEYLKLMRELMRLQREKLKKAGTASAFEEGAVPAHPAGVHQHEDEDEKNDGPTQNLETNSSRLGLDPAGYLVSRRGHMG